MMRQPKIRKSAQGLRRALSDFLTAPIGGWNARDPLDRMKATEAVVLENWFPRPGSVDLRGGYSNFSTGFTPDTPQVMMSWNGQAGSKLLAVTQAHIYDVSTGGARGAAVANVTGTEMSWVNFEVAGGAYLVAVNGQDLLKLYNGTTWQNIDGVSTPAITGVTTSDLTSVAVAHRRLWFTKASSTSAWYLPTAAVGGALTEFPLGQVFTRGGYLVGIATWSSDAGDGQDDYTVFASSEGELAVYRGTDPASASTFAKVGVMSVAAPIGGFRCFAKFGGDLLFLCELGLFRLSKLLGSKDSIIASLALTDKIDRAFALAVKSYRTNINWQVLDYPREQALLVNIPITTSYSEQYVMNTLTGAWAKFTGWSVQNMVVHERELFGAGTDAVLKLWAGVADDDGVIRGKLQSAYNYFGLRGLLKHVKLFAPMLQTTAAVASRLGVDVDFSMKGAGSPAAINPPEGSTWDGSTWDDAYWAGDFTVATGWVSVPCSEGFAHSVLYQVETRTAEVKLLGFNIAGDRGGPM